MRGGRWLTRTASTRCSLPTTSSATAATSSPRSGLRSPRVDRVVATLISACTRLEQASALFQQAMTRTGAEGAARRDPGRARCRSAACPGPARARRTRPRSRVRRRDTHPVATSYSRDRFARLVAGGVIWAFVVGNVIAIVWIWIANHNLDFSFAPDYWATLMARLGGLTGLLAAFSRSCRCCCSRACRSSGGSSGSTGSPSGIAGTATSCLAARAGAHGDGGARLLARRQQLVLPRVLEARRRQHPHRDGHGHDRARPLRGRHGVVDRASPGASSRTSSGTRCT